MAKEIIKNIVYNTKKSELVADSPSQINKLDQTMYKTENGRWFLFANSRHSFTPINEKKAKELLLEWHAVDALELYFPGSIEDA